MLMNAVTKKAQKEAGQRIKKAREDRGLTQEAACALLPRPVLAIKRWEAGSSVMEPALWALYRARLALVDGDERKALDVLRETL